MTLNDLKGLKKDDKLNVLRNEFGNIDHDALIKLSIDVSPDVKYQLAQRLKDSDILYSMLINPKNWGDRLISTIMTNKSFTDDDRLKFLESKIWMEAGFLKLNSSARNELFKFFNMPDDRVIETFLNAIKGENNIPSGYTRQALWYTSNSKQILEVVHSISDKDWLVDIFDIGAVMDLLTIEDKRELALSVKEVFKKYTYHLPDIYFERVVDDKLMQETVDISNMTDSSFIALFKNKDISNKTYDLVFDYVSEKIKSISSTKLNTVLTNIPLDSEKTEFFVEYIKNEYKRSNSGLVSGNIFSIISNPTIDKERIISFFENVHGFNVSAALAHLHRSALTDEELDEFVSKYGTYTDESDNFLVSFARALEQKIEVRPSFVMKVWSYLLKTKLTRDNISNTPQEISTPEILESFFSTRGNQTILPLEIRVKCGYEYFKTNKILDWVTYSDDLTEEQIDEIWHRPEISWTLDKFPREYIWGKKIKNDILQGKYKDKYGIMYFEDTGDENFMPKTVKDIFLF